VGSTLRRELAALIVLGLAVLVAARHLLLEPGFATQDPTALGELLAIEQLQRVVTGQQAWGEAWLGWPVGPGVAQADWLLGQALLAWPLAGLDPASAYALLALLGIFATAWVGHRAAAELMGPSPATWIAGAAAGLAPILLGLGTPLGLVHAWVPIAGALLLGRGLSRSRPWQAGLGAALLAGSAHWGWQQGLHALILLLVVAGLAAARRWGDRRTLLAAAIGQTVGLVSLIPPALAVLALVGPQHARWDPVLPGARWGVLPVAALGLAAAALLTRRELARLPAIGRPVLVVILLVPMLLVAPSPTDHPRHGHTIPEVYVGLEAIVDGPLYERHTALPHRCTCDRGPARAAALLHGRPMVGGSWAWDSAALAELEAVARRFPEAQAAELLRILGVTVVIEHAPVSGPPPDGASCQRVADHRLCVLEPMVSGGLPVLQEVETMGHGPVVGLRFTTPPSADRLQLRCEQQRPWRTTVEAWSVLSHLRQGPSATQLDVYLPEPCPTVPNVSEGSPLPLYAVGAMDSP